MLIWGVSEARVNAKDDVMTDGLGIENAPTEPVAHEPAEKMLPQSEVDRIAGRRAQEAATKAVEAYKRQQADSVQHSQQTHQSTGEFLNEERIRKMAGEEAQRLRNEWVQEAQTRAETETAQRIVRTFYDKIATGKDKYDDFDKVTSTVKLERFPNTVQMLAEHVDNSGDVLYELSKNRSKLAQIEQTAEKFPEEALWDLQRLSESIKSNESVANRKQPNAPLSQQRPSNIGTDSGGVLSIRDLKAKYRV